MDKPTDSSGTRDRLKGSGLFAKPATDQKATDSQPDGQRATKPKADTTNPTAKRKPRKTAKSAQKQPKQLNDSAKNDPVADHLPNEATENGLIESRADTKRMIARKMSKALDCIRTPENKSDVNRAIHDASAEVLSGFDAIRRIVLQRGREIERLQAELEEAKAAIDPIAREAPTKEELIGIVSKAIRDSRASGSDVKGLTATLERLMPDLFGLGENGAEVPPEQLLNHIIHCSGMPGHQVVKELGGVEFLQDKLADFLKVESVRIVHKSADPEG